MDDERVALNSVDEIMAAPDSPAGDDNSSAPAADGDKSAQAATSDSSAETQNTDAEGDSTKDATQAGDDAAGKDDAGKDVPFHEHPRFKELIEIKNTLSQKVQDLEAKLEKASQATKGQEGPPDVQARVAEMQSKLDAELEKLDARIDEGDITDGEYRKEERQLVRQFEAEKQKAMEEYQAVQAEQEKVYQQAEAKFLGDRPWLKETLENKGSDIDAVVRDSGGIHDRVSAAQEVYIKDLESKLQETEGKIETAKKEAREQAIKEFKAKRQAQTLGGGPAAAPSPTVDADLADSKRAGGATALLAKRLAARRQQAL